jgi:hypothetical protein
MAKVTIEFDTNDKYAEVKVDGKLLNDLSYVCLSKRVPYGYDGYSQDSEDADEFSCYISQMSKEDDGMTKMSSIMASQKTQGAFVPAKTVASENKVAQEIFNYLKKK